MTIVAGLVAVSLLAACTTRTPTGDGRIGETGASGTIPTVSDGTSSQSLTDPATGTSGLPVETSGGSGTSDPAGATGSATTSSGASSTVSVPPLTTSTRPTDPTPLALRSVAAAAIAWGPTSARLSAAVSKYLFASSPVVVLATPAAVENGLVAKEIGTTPLPILITPGTGGGAAGGADSDSGADPGADSEADGGIGDVMAADRLALATEVSRLQAHWVLGIGSGAHAAAARLIDQLRAGEVTADAGSSGASGGAGLQPAAVIPDIITSLDDALPLESPDPLAGVVGLVSADLLDAPAGTKGGSAKDGSAKNGSGSSSKHGANGPTTAVQGGISALRMMAESTGMRLVPIDGSDPRADTAVIAALAARPPNGVMAVGPGFSSTKRFASRVATAETGVELPGGGQVMFPGRTLVALYGHPSSSALGALGQQDLAASIKRAATVAKPYRNLVDGPVVPTFEIIASVATASAGADGNYTVESRVATLKPWVDKATAAGMYVILDLQPGRAHLLDQAKAYKELLSRPNVGLALDPEWKLGPNQRPLEQIGSVEAAEVNAVIDWLGALVAKHHLPQKVLVLHQFKLSMLRDEDDIKTRHDNVAVLIHMDGQGSPSGKEATWRAIVANAPDGTFFGWKNFYEMDHPMMSPAETMDRKPKPVMISYQ